MRISDTAGYFELAQVRNSFARGDYTAFKTCVEQHLERDDVVQFLADGEAYLPIMSEDKFEATYREFQKYRNCAMLCAPDLQILFFGKTFELVALKVQDELNLMYQDGFISEAINLGMHMPRNDN